MKQEIYFKQIDGNIEIIQNESTMLLLGDSLHILKQMKEKTIDLIFADPPYDIEGLDTLPDRIFDITTNLPEKNTDYSSNEKKIQLEESSDEKKSQERKKLIKKGGYFILEHPKAYSFENHPFFIKEKKYGNVHFSFFGEKE